MKPRIRVAGIIALSAALCLGCGSSGSSTPAEKSWGTPVLLQQDNNSGSSRDPAISDIDPRFGPVVRFNASGNAMVAWPQLNAEWDIVAVRYDGGWGTASAVDNASENAFRPMFAWDGLGVGHLVWYEWDGLRYNLWTRRFLPGSGWEGTFTRIAADCGDTPGHSIEADGGGNAFVIWNRTDPADPTVKNVFVSRFDNSAVSWDAPVTMDNNSDAAEGKIAATPSGTAFAAWIQDGGSYRTVHARRYVPSAGGGGWESPEMLSADNVVATEIEIAVDEQGNAIAAWAQQEDGKSHIWATRYVAGSGWGPREPVETDNAAHSALLRLRMNASGSAVAAWRHSDVVSHLWANLYDPSRGWGVAGPIEPDTVEPVMSTPAVAIDPHGDAIAVWRRADGSVNSLFANRYVVGRGWGEPVPVESEPGDVGPELGLDVDASGNAIAVWLQDDGTAPSGRYTVRASVFR